MWNCASCVMSWLRQLGASLSLQRVRCESGPVHLRFVVDKVSLRQVFLRVLQLYYQSFHHYSTLIIVLILLLSEGQAVKHGNPHTSQCCLGKGGE